MEERRAWGEVAVLGLGTAAGDEEGRLEGRAEEEVLVDGAEKDCCFLPDLPFFFLLFFFLCFL